MPSGPALSRCLHPFPVRSGKWPLQTPGSLGQYPAASIIYRKGYIKEGPIVINETLKLDDLYKLKGATLSQPLGLDAFQASKMPAGAEAEVKSLPGVDPLSFFVGRVVRTIGDNPGKSTFMNTSTLIDRKAKVLRSATGELVLDYGKALVTLNAPCAQGAAGFLKAEGVIELQDVAVHLTNEYASVMLVSLDGKPLATSGRILLQVMTEEKNFGWKTRAAKASFSRGGEGPKEDCLEITDIGAPPICVRKIAGTVSLKRSDGKQLKVTALDFQGYAREELKGGAKSITLLPDCLYYLVEKK